MTLLLAGGTGLIEQAFLAACAVNQFAHHRRGQAANWTQRGHRCRLRESPAMPPARVAVCTLGTTIRAAGSQDALFRDFNAVIAFATAAKETGVEHFLTVTAVGANTNSSVFYSRVKGDVERELSSMYFNASTSCSGLLLGNRYRKSVETLLKWMAPGTDLLMQGPWRKYRSIAAHTVAKSLLVLTTHSAPDSTFTSTMTSWRWWQKRPDASSDALFKALPLGWRSDHLTPAC